MKPEEAKRVLVEELSSDQDWKGLLAVWRLVGGFSVLSKVTRFCLRDREIGFVARAQLVSWIAGNAVRPSPSCPANSAFWKALDSCKQQLIDRVWRFSRLKRQLFFAVASHDSEMRISNATRALLDVDVLCCDPNSPFALEFEALTNSIRAQLQKLAGGSDASLASVIEADKLFLSLTPQRYPVFIHEHSHVLGLWSELLSDSPDGTLDSIASLRRKLDLDRVIASSGDAWHKIQLANSLDTLGELFRDVFDHKNAQESFREAVSVRNAVMDEHPADMMQQNAASLIQCAFSMMDEGHPENAVQVLVEADALLTEMPSTLLVDASVEQCRLRLCRGSASMLLGAFEDAIEELNDAYNIARSRRLDAQLPLVLQALSAANERAGNFSESLRNCTDAIDCIDSQDEYGKALLASLLRNLGNLQSRGFYCHADADLAYSRSLEIRRQLHQACPQKYGRDLAGTLWAAGNSMTCQHRYEEAIACFAEAYALQKALGQSTSEADRREFAFLLSNYSIAKHSVGAEEEAITLARESLEIKESFYKQNAKQHAEYYASGLNDFSLIAAASGHEIDAVKRLLEAKLIWEQLVSEYPDAYRTHLDNCRLNLIDLLIELKRTNRPFADVDILTLIRDTLESCHTSHEDESGRRNVQFATGLSTAAAYVADSGDSETACELYELSFVAFPKSMDPDAQRAFVTALFNFSQLLLHQGKLAYSTEVLDHAAGLCKAMSWRSFTAVQIFFERAQLFKLGKASEIDQAFELLVMAREIGNEIRGRTMSTVRRRELQEKMLDVYDLLSQICFLRGSNESAELLDLAFRSCEDARSRTLSEMLSENLYPSNVPNEVMLQLHELRYRADIAVRTFGCSELQVELPPLRSPDGKLMSQQEISNGEKALHSAMKEYFDFVRLIQIEYDPLFDPECPIESISLEQARKLLPDAETAAIQFSVTRRGSYAVLLTVTGACHISLDDCSAEWIELLETQWKANYDDVVISRNWESWANENDQILSRLSDALLKPILGSLNGISRLILAPHRQLHAFPLHACPIGNDLRLVDCFEVCFTPSMSILNRITLKPRPKSNGTPLLVNVESGLWFSDLEIKCLNAIAEHSTVTKPSAGEMGEFFEQSQRCLSWHYPGHCRFNPEEPLKSSLRGSELGDWLLMEDVFTRLRFDRCQLVTLSACESGMMLPEELDEHVSFPLAFHYAGAHAVVSSLWRVLDVPAFLLMLQFWRNQSDGLNIGRAFHEAQNWLRGKADHRGMALGSGQDLLEHLQSQVFAKLDIETKPYSDRCRKYTKRTDAPFASPAYWAAFSISGRSW